MTPRRQALADALRALAAVLETEVDLDTPEPANDVGAAPGALLDRRAVAKHLGVSLAQIDRLARRDHDPLPFVRVGDVRRFEPAAIDAWIARQRGDT